MARAPGLLQAAVQSMQSADTAWAATYVLSNVACSQETGVGLASYPGLLPAAVKAIQSPVALPALTLLINLASTDANKMTVAQTPGLFAAVDHAVMQGGDVGARAQRLADLLQQQRILSMMQVAVPAMPVMGAPQSETMSSQQVQLMMMHWATPCVLRSVFNPLFIRGALNAPQRLTSTISSTLPSPRSSDTFWARVSL